LPKHIGLLENYVTTACDSIFQKLLKDKRKFYINESKAIKDKDADTRIPIIQEYIVTMMKALSAASSTYQFPPDTLQYLCGMVQDSGMIPPKVINAF